MSVKKVTKQGLILVHGRWNWIKRLVAGGLVLVLVLVATLTILPATSPAFGADMADFLRAIFGPQPVARLESTSFKLHDALNRLLYKNGKPQIAWNYSTQPETFKLGGASKLGLVVPNKLSLLGSDVVSASPQIGWQAYGPSVNGVPVLARTMVKPDPQRPYAAVALVRMDLSELELHMMPGTLEPAHPAQLAQVIPTPGMIPPSAQNYLVAAFNGGFKAVHGHYGMMVNGVTLLQAIPNIATVAIYRDGHVQIGVWGKDLNLSSDIIAFRQNCPPLIDAGQLNPNLFLNNDQGAWGYTVNTDITWRTGLGITQDRRYLIYAVGNGTSAATLAQVLQNAGAYSAMQLDINQYYAHFETYQPVTGSAASQGFQLTGEPLLDKMTNVSHLYLTPGVRDFFYLTVQTSSLAGQKGAGG